MNWIHVFEIALGVALGTMAWEAFSPYNWTPGWGWQLLAWPFQMLKNWWKSV